MVREMKKPIRGFGMRSIKTAIAVAASFAVIMLLNLCCTFFQNSAIGLLGAANACVAAVLSLQSSMRKSFKSGAALIVSTLIGAGFGILFLEVRFDFSGTAALLLETVKLFLGVLLCIALCNLLKHPHATTFACIVFLTVVFIPHTEEKNHYIYAAGRLVETILGITIAIAVNCVFNRRPSCRRNSLGGKHMPVLTVTKDTMQAEVIDSSQTVLLDFFAPWCGPCRMLAPVIDQIASENPDIKVVKISIDDEPELTQEYGIMTVPTLIVMKNGKEVNRSGSLPKARILDMLK